MSRKAMLQECDHATSELLCDQPRPIQKALSCLLLGLRVRTPSPDPSPAKR